MRLRNMPMPLRVGIAMRLFALTLAAMVAVAVWLRSDQPDPTSASGEQPVATQSPAQKERNAPNRGK